MRTRISTRSLFALLICSLATLSTIYNTNLAPVPVFGDDNLTIQLTRAATSTEPTNATGAVQVNSQTGQAQLTLNQTTSNATYTVIFASLTGATQLGTLSTDLHGSGTNKMSLTTGVYAGSFKVLRNALVQFISNNLSITVGMTTSAIVSEQTSATTTISIPTISVSENETQTVAQANNTLHAEFHVEPSLRSVTSGGYASYNIRLRQEGNASIFLATKNIPPDSVAIFSRSNGLAAPEFNSTLTIITSANTLPATYTITIVALVNGHEYDNQITLVVNSPTATTIQSGNNTIPTGTSLILSIETDRHHYQSNSTIFLEGHVTDNLGNAMADASVNIQIDGEKGGELAVLTRISTNTAGGFQADFKLPSNAQPGTYTAFASASKQGYASATTRTTFIVELSTTPSVVIESVYTGDSAGNPVAVFSQGQTVYVWVTIENIGATFNGVIWVQIRDPSGVPVQVLIRISSLASGQTFSDGFGFPLQGTPTPGLYSVNALVSDNLISQGGVFLASANAQFEVTSS